MKVSTLSIFVVAAMVPKKLMVEKGLAMKLISVGCTLSGQEYNHTLAKLVGCMLLEANTFEQSAMVMEKIGGRSPLTATKLSGVSLEIQRGNASRFPLAKIADRSTC